MSSRTGARLGRLGRSIFALSILAVALMWIAVDVGAVRLTSAGHLLMAVAATAAAVGGVTFLLGQVRAMRRLRERGVTATAVIEKVHERYVYVANGFSGWTTSITVTFAAARGEPARASYTDYARAGGKRVGQSLPIVFDPDRPDLISPLGDDARPEDQRFMEVFLTGVGVVGLLVVAGYFLLRSLG